jgi:hypothetical protein
MSTLANDTWIYHGENKAESSADNVIFIYNHKNVFVSDNHLTAFWSWMQKCDPNSKYQFVHIDYHMDTAPYRDEFSHFQYTEELMDIQCYLDAKDYSNNKKIFRWDTYIPLAYKSFPLWFEKSVFMTKECPYDSSFDDCSMAHCNQSCKNVKNDDGMNICHVCKGIEEIETYINEHLPIILNIDIDFFIDVDDSKRSFMHEKVESFSQKISQFINVHDIAVCTIALSPEVCGGWGNVMEILSIMSKCAQSLFPGEFIRDLLNQDYILQ